MILFSLVLSAFLQASTSLVDSFNGQSTPLVPFRRTTTLLHFSFPPPSPPAIVRQFVDTNAADREVEKSAFIETKNLVEKYYLHKNTLQRNVRYQKVVGGPDVASPKVLLASLGDKYSRYVTKEGYSKIQKFDLIGVGVMFVPEGGEVSGDVAGQVSSKKDDSPDNKGTASTRTTFTVETDPKLSDDDTMNNIPEKVQNQRLTIGAPPVPNSPGDSAGLRKGDIVEKVNSVDVSGMTSFQVIDLVNARSDGLVSLDIARLTDTVTLKREVEKVKNPVEVKLLPDGVGYLKMSEFNSLSTSRFSEGVQKLIEERRSYEGGEGLRGLVVDLRGNGGGSFQSAVDVGGEVIGGGKTIAMVFDGNDFGPDDELIDPSHSGTEIKTKAAQQQIIGDDVPIIVLVDGGTASASEVLTIGLRDNCRAAIGSTGDGTRSYGKGLIQAVYGLLDGGGAVVTVGEYRGLRGEQIQKVGVSPDLILGQKLENVDFNQAASVMKLCREFGK